MGNWIFQGNPKQFDVDAYLLTNEKIAWNIRQQQFIDEIQVGDQVFIWRADGGAKNTGGVIALCRVQSKPYWDDSIAKVDLEIIEKRQSVDEGMLLRHELREIPDTMNLHILKMSNMTNYRLSDDEFEKLVTLWNSPEEVKKQLDLSTVEKFLHSFKSEASNWFQQNQTYLQEGYQFFSQFKRRDHIQSMDWAAIQELGDHINAFRMALAKKRALGNMNAPIEYYRSSFEYLIVGNEPIRDRIDKFISHDDYKLFGFGTSVVSELVGNLFPEEYCFYNQRDKVAVENILGLVPAYTRGDTFGDKFMKFQDCLEKNRIVEKYLEIIGKQTDLPIYYEVDQFFSYLFERFGENGNSSINDDTPQYWILGAGEGSFMWDDFSENEHIGIGWEELGDLKQYNSKREIAESLKESYQLDYIPNNDALANYQFVTEMKIGDYVFVKKGIRQIIALGKIVSDYKHDASRKKYHSLRDVEWLAVGEWTVQNQKLNTKTLTEVTQYEELVEELLEMVTEKNEPPVPNPLPTSVKEASAPYTTEQILVDVFMDAGQIEEILETIDYKQNIILQGPPGVGKTFVAKRLAYLHMGSKDDSKVEMIQFHQSYSYEDFIRGYKPTNAGNFTLKDGIFYSFCKKAIEDPEGNYYMIIDEINRGNLSKIFGEVMMLIEADKRGKKFAVKLAYSESEETFYIPKNLFLIGTMNTADRSLALVDYALRRRFSFISMEPAFHTEQFRDHLSGKGVSQGFIDKLVSVIGELNQAIINDTLNLGKGYEIGHSYFCPTTVRVDDEQKWFERIIRLEIVPLLREYWFDEEDKVNDLLEKLN